MKGHTKEYHHTHGTHEKIEKHIAKHRAYGGRTDTAKGKGKESAMDGRDEADMDLHDTPKDRTKPSNVDKTAKEKSDKAEEHKHGGRAKKHRKDGGPVAGHWPSHNAGRKARASGGTAEDNPFTTANKSTPASGRKIMRVTEGLDKE